jgi:hypothetical protein
MAFSIGIPSSIAIGKLLIDGAAATIGLGGIKQLFPNLFAKTSLAAGEIVDAGIHVFDAAVAHVLTGAPPADVAELTAYAETKVPGIKAKVEAEIAAAA